MRDTSTPDDAVIAYDLPLTPDGDRTFSVTLGPSVYAFRSYYVVADQDYWYLDVYDANYQPLALGRRLITGSINMLQGYANALDGIAAVVYTTEGVDDLAESLGASLRVIWFPDREENPLENGDPMDYLLENFYIAQDD